MGLDAQCCIFGELIVCAYSTGTYGVYVRKCQLGCTMYGTAMRHTVLRMGLWGADWYYVYVVWYGHTCTARSVRVYGAGFS